MASAEEKMKELTGPGTTEQWLYWRSQSGEQKNRAAAAKELEKVFDIKVKVGIRLFALVSSHFGGFSIYHNSSSLNS